MVTILIISLIIILYLCIRWLYKEYKLNIIDSDFVSLQDEIRISRLERKNIMNEKMINKLWEEVAKKKLEEQRAKERKEKEGK